MSDTHQIDPNPKVRMPSSTNPLGHLRNTVIIGDDDPNLRRRIGLEHSASSDEDAKYEIPKYLNTPALRLRGLITIPMYIITSLILCFTLVYSILWWPKHRMDPNTPTSLPVETAHWARNHLENNPTHTIPIIIYFLIPTRLVFHGSIPPLCGGAVVRSGIRRGVLGLCAGFVVMFVAVVALGGPFLDINTIYLALILSSLTFLPLSTLLSYSWESWERIVFRRRPMTIPEQAVFGPAFGACFCAWASAIVIPLDWDRPWQIWPIPCLYGAMFGYVIGTCVTMVKIMRKKTIH